MLFSNNQTPKDETNQNRSSFMSTVELHKKCENSEYFHLQILICLQTKCKRWNNDKANLKAERITVAFVRE